MLPYVVIADGPLHDRFSSLEAKRRQLLREWFWSSAESALSKGFRVWIEPTSANRSAVLLWPTGPTAKPTAAVLYLDEHTTPEGPSDLFTLDARYELGVDV